MDIAAFLTALGWGQYVPASLAVVGFASALTAILPQAKPGTPWYYPRKALDLIAANVGNGKVAAAPDSAHSATSAPTVPSPVPAAAAGTGAAHS
jgi:hypothetical protein